MSQLSVFAGSVCLLNEYAKYRYGKDFRKDESFPPLQKKDVVLSGHTHIPITEPTDGGLFFNPGSVSIPKNGSKNGYMTLENGLFIWKSFEDGEYARYKL